MLLDTLIVALTVWIAVVTVHAIATRKIQVKYFSFSPLHYYILVSPLVAGVIIQFVRINSFEPIMYFATFGVAGVIGESLVSVWWHRYFSRRFWFYTAETLYHKYTSWLNFIPWGIGGMLYISIFNSFGVPFNDPRFDFAEFILFLVFTIGICLQLIIYRLLISKNSQNRFHTLSSANIIFFYAPIAFFIAVLAQIYGYQMLHIAISFGLVACLAEYLFGKATEYFILKKLWIYTYVSLDRGHFTPLAIPFFIIGGFYFWAVALFLDKIL